MTARPFTPQEEALARMCLARHDPIAAPSWSTLAKALATIDVLKNRTRALEVALAKAGRSRVIGIISPQVPAPPPTEPAA